LRNNLPTPKEICMTYPIPAGFHPYPDTDRLFYASAGPLYIRHMAGKLQFGMSLAEKHMNALMITHGGVLMFMMDMQLSLAGAFEGKIAGFGSTIQMASDFLAPTQIGDWLHGDTRLVRRGRNMVFVDGTITANEEKLVLRANGIMTVPKEAGDWNVSTLVPPEYVPGSEGQG
jgi:uncharacterized protein (TIGR00369 family)